MQGAQLTLTASSCLPACLVRVPAKFKGYSNPAEVPIVVQQARAALQRYGAHADIRVITFYNMQKLALERKFNRQRDLARIRIGSVRVIL